jgi:hypothetical protein
MALSNYLRLAIDRDWPQMSAGGKPRGNAAAVREAETGSKEPAIFVETFKQLDSITQARCVRLHIATGIVPGILWVALFCGAVLTVGFTFFFGTENLPAHTASIAD